MLTNNKYLTIMIRKTVFTFITVIAVLAFAGCKKSSSSATSSGPTPFIADTLFTLVQANAFPAYDGWNSIAMDTSGNKIFFYYGDATDGFKIDMLDVSTGNITTIYKHFTQSGQSTWHTSNGSEGMRLRYFPGTFNGNKLIVPGATNSFIVEIKVNADYSTTFQQVDAIPGTANSISVNDGYDSDLAKISTTNLISIVSMYNSVYNLNTTFPAYTVSTTSHGSSIVGTPGALEYVFCGTAKTLELYNNGAFLRSVSLPAGESQLQMDSKNRINAYNGTSIFRYSSDLMTKTEYPIKGTLEGYRQSSMVISHISNYVQIYTFNGKDLIGMRIPW